MRTAHHRAGADEAGHARTARKGPRWLNQAAYLFVLAGVGGGLAWIALHHFKRGSALIAGTLLLSAVLRLVLPERRVGMLASGSRFFDVFVLGALGLGVAIIAFWVPQPS